MSDPEWCATCQRVDEKAVPRIPRQRMEGNPRGIGIRNVRSIANSEYVLIASRKLRRGMPIPGIGDRTRMVHVDGHPYLWLIEQLLERCANLERIQVIPLMHRRLNPQRHLLLCAQRGVQIVTGHHRPDLAWDDGEVRSPTYLPQQRFFQRLQGEQRDLFQELLVMGFEEAEITARYFCLGGEPYVTLHDVGSVFGYGDRVDGYISSIVNGVIRYLDPTHVAGQDSKRTVRVLRRRVPRLRSLLRSDAAREQEAKRLGIPHLPDRLPLARLYTFGFLLEAKRRGALGVADVADNRIRTSVMLRFGIEGDVPSSYRTLEVVGQMVEGLTRERIRQYEVEVLQDLGIEDPELLADAPHEGDVRVSETQESPCAEVVDAPQEAIAPPKQSSEQRAGAIAPERERGLDCDGQSAERSASAPVRFARTGFEHFTPGQFAQYLAHARGRAEFLQLRSECNRRMQVGGLSVVACRVLFSDTRYRDWVAERKRLIACLAAQNDGLLINLVQGLQPNGLQVIVHDVAYRDGKMCVTGTCAGELDGRRFDHAQQRARSRDHVLLGCFLHALAVRGEIMEVPTFESQQLNGIDIAHSIATMTDETLVGEEQSRVLMDVCQPHRPAFVMEEMCTAYGKVHRGSAIAFVAGQCFRSSVAHHRDTRHIMEACSQELLLKGFTQGGQTAAALAARVTVENTWGNLILACLRFGCSPPALKLHYTDARESANAVVTHASCVIRVDRDREIVGSAEGKKRVEAKQLAICRAFAQLQATMA